MEAYYDSEHFKRALKITEKASDKFSENTLLKLYKKKADKEGYFETISQLYPDIPKESHFLGQFKELDEMEEQDDWGKTTTSNTFGLFVTLSPEPGQFTPQDMLATFRKMLGRPKAGIKEAIWSVEQSGTNDATEGYHPHIHAVIMLDKQAKNGSGERNKVKSMLIRNLSKYKTKSDHYLQIKPVSVKNWNNKVNYVKGVKTDEDKHAQVARDQIWRKANEFQKFYQHPEPQVNEN